MHCEICQGIKTGRKLRDWPEEARTGTYFHVYSPTKKIKGKADHLKSTSVSLLTLWSWDNSLTAPRLSFLVHKVRALNLTGFLWALNEMTKKEMPSSMLTHRKCSYPKCHAGGPQMRLQLQQFWFKPSTDRGEEDRVARKIRLLLFLGNHGKGIM